MGKPKRKPPEQPAALPSYGSGVCLVCRGSARDATAAEVPEVMAFNGRRCSGDELENHARRRLEMREGCITFWKSGFSICWVVRLVGASGDDTTERALAALRKLGR